MGGATQNLLPAGPLKSHAARRRRRLPLTPQVGICSDLFPSVHGTTHNGCGDTPDSWAVDGQRVYKSARAGGQNVSLSVETNTEDDAENGDSSRQCATLLGLRVFTLQSTQAGKPRVAYPTIKRLLMHTSIAMKATNLL